jgi:hypothetical protein
MASCFMNSVNHVAVPFCSVQATVLKQHILQFSGYVWTENKVCFVNPLILVAVKEGPRPIYFVENNIFCFVFVNEWCFAICMMTCVSNATCGYCTPCSPLLVSLV